MKYKSLHMLMLTACISVIAPVLGKQIMTFFIQPYPVMHTREFKKYGAHHQLIRSTIGDVAGIFATYAGYLALSNAIGQISLPRKQQKPAFHLVITNKIKPIPMLKGIVHNWRVADGTDAAIYMVARTQDPETKIFYWNVTRSSLDKKRNIPLNAIVVFAKPQNVVVPTGITLTTKSPQLLLPPIWAKQTIDDAANALQVLSIRQFFSPLRSIIRRKPHGFARITQG